MQAISSILRASTLAGAMAIAVAAHANDGTIVITGSITDTTCVIEQPAGPDHLQVVILPTISKNALRKPGDQAGRTRFDIKLKDCPSSVGNGIKLYFEPGATTDYATGDLKAYKIRYSSSAPVTQTAQIVGATETTGVQIRLSNVDDSKVTMGATETMQGAQGFDPVAQGAKKAATLSYLASYVRKTGGDVDTGSITTYVGFSVVYP
ncbi:fimbrial protein [Bordetella genomosp. 6]|uniref:Fimbrial protein n=1 Tax=Bordetella genomosp. 6 TaxID=463024 RepID=A0ABX4FL80_9BORD|nr:fimbrial protein [Bordetella genomosp. 6]OZI82342.1 fimbrial protein [Bordetella genomosp. 6]